MLQGRAKAAALRAEAPFETSRPRAVHEIKIEIRKGVARRLAPLERNSDRRFGGHLDIEGSHHVDRGLGAVDELAGATGSAAGSDRAGSRSMIVPEVAGGAVDGDAFF